MQFGYELKIFFYDLIHFELNEIQLIKFTAGR